MMHVFRKNVKVVIWVLVIAFVGTIIFAWGMDIAGFRGGGGGAPTNVVGVINGREVPITNFSRAADQWIENERAKDPGKEFTESDYRQARRETWNTYIAEYLQAAKIEQAGIRLTDAELVEFLKNYPPQEVYQVKELQTDGRFDYSKYLAAMKDPNFQPLWVQVEAMMRPQLIKFKLQEYIAGMVRVNNTEIQDKFIRENERIKVNYGVIPYGNFDISVIKIDSAQVREYYNQHPEKYRTEEMAYYNVLRLPKEPTERDNMRALEEAQEVKAMLDQGANFDTLANARTQDASGKGKGGDLGWFGHGQMVAAFDSAVFAMADSTISTPIKTQFGYHIIYRKGIRTTDGKEEVNAAHILIKPVMGQETIDELEAKMRQFRERALTTDYTPLLGEYGIIDDGQRKTGREGSISVLGRDPEAIEWLFDAAPGTFSDVYDQQNAFLLLLAGRKIQAGLVPLEEVHSSIERDLKTEQQKKQALAQAERVYSFIVGGSTLTDAFKSINIEAKESPFFSRIDRVAGVGQDPNFIGAAFALSEANRFSKPVLTQSGAAIIEFREKMPTSLADFDAQKDTLKVQALQTLQSAYWNKWYEKTRNTATVEDYRKDVFGDQL